jgi:hypothetical protein
MVDMEIPTAMANISKFVEVTNLIGWNLFA